MVITCADPNVESDPQGSGIIVRRNAGGLFCTARAQHGHRAIVSWLSRDNPENHPTPGKHLPTRQTQQIQTAIWHL